MAQYTGSIYWWRTNLHTHFANPSFSGMALRSFLSRPAWEDIAHGANPNPDNSGLGVGLGKFLAHPNVVCFRDDDCPFPDNPLERDAGSLSLRTNSEIRYSPWATSMLNGLGKIGNPKIRESTGGPTGGGKGDDDGGGGDGGGGGGDDEGEGHIFLLPLLTLAFAAFHMGYCIAVWVKDENLDNEFLRTGFGLFCLLVLSAIRLNNRTGIDAYILGLGASVGVMVWTGERCFVKREGNPSGIVALFAASMAVMFTAALYHSI
eukprot:Gb_34044 [translate_table: standard]